MDKSEVKAEVEKNLLELMDAVGIRHWNIVVNFDLREGDEHRVTRAMCHASPDYEFAKIQMDPDALPDRETVLEALRHELFHCLLSPLDVYREAMTQHIENGTPEAQREARLWHHFLERSVANLERMWNGCREYWVKHGKSFVEPPATLSSF